MEVGVYRSPINVAGGEERYVCPQSFVLNTYLGCGHGCSYCLSGDTLILMSDGSSIPIKNIKIGDSIIGTYIDEKTGYRKLKNSKVLNHWKTYKPAYKITLRNGQELTCSKDHRWLTKRGWKYTKGTMQGFEQRPYLTTSNSMVGIGKIIETPVETDEYKKGYLSGVIKGDGTMGIYSSNRSHSFRLAMMDESVIIRVDKYLKYFGIKTFRFLFKNKDKKPLEAIRTYSIDSYNNIKMLTTFMDNKEFFRGFLAGIFDAEGSNTGNYPGSVLRISNTDIEILSFIEKGLNIFGFKYIYDNKKNIYKNSPGKKICHSIRILGGIIEHLRFFQTSNPELKRKLRLENTMIKNSLFNELKIKSVIPLGIDIEMYDITTETKDFIAEGIVSHNCCARYLLEMYKHWEKMQPADISLIRKRFEDAFVHNKKGIINDLMRRRTPFRFSNLTDPFQEMENKYKVTYETLKILAEYNYPAIIVTKGIIWAKDEYLEILKKFPVVLQTTITTTDDVLIKKLEPEAPLASERIKAIEKGAKNGIITQVRYSPVFPLLTDQPQEYFKTYSEIGVKDIVCEFYRSPTGKKQQDYLNNGLGFDYLQYLKDNKYPMKVYKHWIKVEKPFIFNEYLRFKEIAQSYGLNFYVCCEERPEINNWENCCGTDKYPGFENSMNWTIQMNGDKFGNTPLKFEDYIKDKDCPYKGEYEIFYNQGKHSGNLYRLTFDGETKTYSIKERKMFFGNG